MNQSSESNSHFIHKEQSPTIWVLFKKKIRKRNNCSTQIKTRTQSLVQEQGLGVFKAARRQAVLPALLTLNTTSRGPGGVEGNGPKQKPWTAAAQGRCGAHGGASAARADQTQHSWPRRTGEPNVGGSRGQRKPRRPHLSFPSLLLFI